MSTRRMRGLAAVCIVLLCADACVAALSLGNVLNQLELAGTDPSRRFFFESALGDVLNTARTLAWIERALVVTTAVCFIPFFAAAYRRLENPRRARWVWLAWLVPIANLYMPFRMAKEIDAPGRANAQSWGVFFWWSSWLASRLLGLLTHLASEGASVRTELLLDASSAGATVLAALSGAGMVFVWRTRWPAETREASR